jgi:hypothetical protein
MNKLPSSGKGSKRLTNEARLSSSRGIDMKIYEKMFVYVVTMAFWN